MAGSILWQLQWSVKKFFRKFGIEIAHYYPEKTEYIRCYPYGYYTYAPWRTPEFTARYAVIAKRTSVSEERAYILSELARQCVHLKGDFAECGVYQGGSAYLLGEILEKKSRALHLFDTFQGMPDFAEKDPSGHAAGDFGDTSFQSVEKFLKKFKFIEFHQGTIPDTFQPLMGKRFAFVHVDVDLYKSVGDCCQFFYDRMVPGGVIVFDDYGFRQYENSARKAVDEFFRDKPERVISVHCGQGFIIKT